AKSLIFELSVLTTKDPAVVPSGLIDLMSRTGTVRLLKTLVNSTIPSRCNVILWGMLKIQSAFPPRMARKRKPTNQGGPVQFRNRAGPIKMITPTDTKTTGMINNIIFRLGGKYNLYATDSSKNRVLSTNRCRFFVFEIYRK